MRLYLAFSLGDGELAVEQRPRPFYLLRQFLAEDITDMRRQVIFLQLLLGRTAICCLFLLLSGELFELEIGVPVESVDHSFDLLDRLGLELLAILEGRCHCDCFLISAFGQVLNLEIAVVLRALFVARCHYRGH